MISQQRRPRCLEFTGVGTTILVLSLPETMLTIFTERILAGAVFASSVKVLGWQLLAEKARSTILQ